MTSSPFSALPEAPKTSGPESDLLVACVRARSLAAGSRGVRVMAGIPEIDWKAVFALARQHCVLPLVYKSLHSCATDLVPALEMQRLRAAYREGTRHNMMLTAEMLSVVAQCKSRGIESVAFKGPVLAQSLYNDISLRSFSDVDILVRKEDLQAASGVLHELGYKGEYELSAKQIADYVREEHAFSFSHEGKGSVIELHWRLAHRNLSFDMEGEGIWKRLETATVFGVDLLVLRVEDLFIYLSMHGAKHYWERLEWICCVSELIDKRRPIDWRIVNNRAAQLGSKRMVQLAFLLSANILDNEYARELLREYPADSVAAMLADEVQRNLFGRDMTHQARQAYRHTFYLQSRERLSDRLRGVIYTCIRTPHPLSKDLGFYHIPKSLSSLYHLLRPFRLAQDHGLGRLRAVLRPGA